MLENGMLAGKVAARADRAWVGGWLVSPSWDVLWILNGMPLALIFLLLGSLLDTRPLLQGAAFVLTAVLWGGHNLSPIVTAWSNTDFRTHMLARRGRFLWFPLALWVAATVVGLLAGSQLTRLAAPDGFGPAAPGPKDHLNGIIALAYLYLVWNQWHFCGQQFGLLTIYRRRLGGAFDPVERAWDRWYCVIFGMVLVPTAWLLNDNGAFQHLSFYLPTSTGLCPVRHGSVWPSFRPCSRRWSVPRGASQAEAVGGETRLRHHRRHRADRRRDRVADRLPCVLGHEPLVHRDRPRVAHRGECLSSRKPSGARRRHDGRLDPSRTPAGRTARRHEGDGRLRDPASRDAVLGCRDRISLRLCLRPLPLRPQPLLVLQLPWLVRTTISPLLFADDASARRSPAPA